MIEVKAQLDVKIKIKGRIRENDKVRNIMVKLKVKDERRSRQI